MMRKPPQVVDLRKYPVTGGTILLAIGLTLAWSNKLVDVTPLMENGEIRRGELWRLLTSSFLHVNLLHLIFNLYWTWVFGTLVEKAFGHLRTMLIFVLLSVVANGSEYALLSGGVGLSGVGYGLFGLVWVLSERDARFTDAVDSKTIQLFVVWFFICIAMTVAGYPIGNIAHGVGLVTGSLLGWTIASNLRLRAVGAVIITLLTAAVMAADTAGRPWVNLSKYAGATYANEAGEDESRYGYDALIAGDNRKAIRWYRDAVRMNPKVAGSWFNLAIAYQRDSQYHDSIEAYQKANDLDQHNANYRLALAEMKAFVSAGESKK